LCDAKGCADGRREDRDADIEGRLRDGSQERGLRGLEFPFGGDVLRKHERRVVDGGMGFASQNDRRLHFGLGSHEWVDRVTIYWPSGSQQVVTRPPIDRFVTITEPER